jgi:exosortase/archaeosortase family protein
VLLPYRLKIFNGPSVETVYACLGLGLMSFWVAFVITYKSSNWKKKFSWTILGVFCIWLINCFRVALILIALQQKKTIDGFWDHHTLFNIVAYSLIFLLISSYIKSTHHQSKISIAVY